MNILKFLDSSNDWVGLDVSNPIRKLNWLGLNKCDGLDGGKLLAD